jgi:hypothetical protein
MQRFLGLHPVEVVTFIPSKEIYEVRVPKNFSVPQFLRLARSTNPGIELEKNHKLQLTFPESFGRKEAGDHFKQLFWSDAQTIMSTNVKKFEKRIRVGVIDSGISPHYDLPKNLRGGMDLNGHGTHVAGIIGAIRGNDRGIEGMTSNADLRIYRVLNHLGGGTVVELIAALVEAQRDGCQIINLSVGTYKKSRLLYQALTDLARDGILMIAAAGNDSTDKPAYPASHPWVIGIGSYKTKRELSSFSNFGKANLTLSLPGEDVISTYIDERLESLSGTSMAAPMLTGILVELLSRVTDMPDPALIFEILRLHAAASNRRYGVTHSPFDFGIFFKEIIKYVRPSGIKKKPGKAPPGALGPSFPRQ